VTTDKQNIGSNTQKKSPFFAGKVIIGVAIVMALSAVIVFFSISYSQSYIIRPFNSRINMPSLDQNPHTIAKVKNVDRHFVLVQNEFGWNGTNGGPTISVSKGDSVQITIINAGMMVHNFGIAKIPNSTLTLIGNSLGNSVSQKMGQLNYNQLSAMPCPGCEPVFSSAQIKFFMQPLSQQVISFNATEAGVFKYFCMVRGHLWLGMMGTLIVDDNNREGGLAL
jgi:FtsP/CotA-like multicopper oxidase with cupredoxin domain